MRNTAANAIQNPAELNSGFSDFFGGGASINDCQTCASGNDSRSFSVHWRRTTIDKQRIEPNMAATKIPHVISGVIHALHGTAMKRSMNRSLATGTRV